MLFINLLIFSAACFLLFKSAGLFVKGAVGLADILKLPKVFVGATIVSLVTTAPEMAVSLIAGYKGKMGLAAGNAIGSAICNIGLVLGVGMIIRDIRLQKEDLKYRLPFLLCTLLVAYIFILDGVIDRIESLFMLLLMALFLAHNYILSIRKNAALQEKPTQDNKQKPSFAKSSVLFLSGGVFTLAIAHYGLLPSAVAIADILGVSGTLIGISLVAFGTSVPELFTTIVASQKRHGEIALGNVIGASIMDIFLLLGILGLMRPIPIDRQTLFFNMPFAFFIGALLFIMGFGKSGLSRGKGIVLIALYSVFIVVLYLFAYK